MPVDIVHAITKSATEFHNVRLKRLNGLCHHRDPDGPGGGTGTASPSVLIHGKPLDTVAISSPSSEGTRRDESSAGGVCV
jgi:hypothetical protein